MYSQIRVILEAYRKLYKKLNFLYKKKILKIKKIAIGCKF